MNPLVASMTEEKVQRQPLLRKDWSSEEASWKKNHGAFLESIALANKDVQEKKEKKAGVVESGVIIKEQAGEPVAGSLAHEKEKDQKDRKMPAYDEFDEALGLVPKDPEPEAEKDDAVFASAEKSSVDFPLAEVEDQKPAEKEQPKKEPKPEKAKKKALPGDVALCEGFDKKTFKEQIMSVADSILVMAPKVDLDEMTEALDQYSAKISVDAYRSDLDTISYHIAEVQAKRDSIIGPLTKLSALNIAYDEVLDFVTHIGLACSAASNRERRLAEVKYMSEDLFTKFVQIQQLYDSYDKINRHLTAQMDALSRLMTAQIEKAKSAHIGAQRHAELKESAGYGGGSGWATDVNQANKPLTGPSGPCASVDVVKEAERIEIPSSNKTELDLSPTPKKETQASSGLSGLESFSAAPVKPSSKDLFKKGIQSW